MLNDLIQEVAEIKGTVASAISLINSLAERIAACECDPAKLAELVTELNASGDALAAAVAANSEPVVPPPPVDEPPPPVEEETVA
jgi:altronate dehydratase